jgi:primase-polymerase (primpol)-like protein
LVKGALPKSGGRRQRGIEIYSAGRYFTITGDHLTQTPYTIQDRQAEILELFAALDKKSRREPEPRLLSGPLVTSDEELIRRARLAKNGAKFQRLWAGDTSEYDGDHSRADAALCSLLAYHTQADEARIDRLFRVSGLYRAKWDRPTAGSTYGSLTIQAVLGGLYR